MIPWLIIAFLAALAFALLGRSMAHRKNRRVFEWGLAAALFPPALLVLLILPSRGKDG
jgi:hypothetical protein